MILTIAKGSLGHYYVGEDGRVYTESHFYVDPSGVLGPKPGERPPKYPHPNAIGGCYAQVSGGTSFWLPTGQEEPLEGEQASILEEAREALDIRWMVVEAREQVACPECGGGAVRDHRILVDGRVPFVCEERHITIDEGEVPDSGAKAARVKA